VPGNAELFKLYKSIGRYYSGRRRWWRRRWRRWRRGWRFLLQHDVLDIEIDLLLVQWWHRLQAKSLEGLQLALIIVHLLVVLEVYIFGREYLCKRHALNTGYTDSPLASVAMIGKNLLCIISLSLVYCVGMGRSINRRKKEWLR